MWAVSDSVFIAHPWIQWIRDSFRERHWETPWIPLDSRTGIHKMGQQESRFGIVFFAARIAHVGLCTGGGTQQPQQRVFLPFLEVEQREAFAAQLHVPVEVARPAADGVVNSVPRVGTVGHGTDLCQGNKSALIYVGIHLCRYTHIQISR